MAKKQNKKSFAQRAKDLIKSYPRASWDTIERTALESSLEKLNQEQEAYKQANQIGEYSPKEMACGGKIYDGVTGTSYLEPKSGLLPTISEEDVGLAGQNPMVLTQQPTAQESQFSPYKSSIAPQIASGATSVLGNLYLANQQRDLSQVELPRISAPEISLERGRQAAKREATKAGQRIKYGVKQGARTRGELMANRAAAEAKLAGTLGETLSASYEKEALVNANMKAGMDKYNAEMAAKEEMINKANQIKNKAEREAYIAAAIGSIPQMTRDISATKAQDRLINSLGEDYGWYMYDQPGRKFYQPKQRKIAYRGDKGLQLAR